jgi:pre-mRNA-splicing factor ISY1
MVWLILCCALPYLDAINIAWEEAYQSARGALGLPTDQPPPSLPRSSSKSTAAITAAITSSAGDTDVDMSGEGAQTEADKAARAAAAAAASMIPFLTVDALMPPKMPTREEMEGVLLALRKRALVEEYFG